ncbi:MAG: hypothetical protein ACXWPK_03895, partial [Isosphaeraceae bacterium]
MDMLLDNMVAAQPDEVVPVVHLILHLGHARLPRAVPESLGVVCAIHGMKHASRIGSRIVPILMARNFSKTVSTTMKVFHCDHCDQLVFFEN